MKENLVLLNTLKKTEDVLNVILEKREIITREFVSLFQEKNIKKIYFSGQASGIYLGLILKKFIEGHFQIEVQVTNPASFLQNECFNINGKYEANELCMICPAHSGSTTGPVEMAKICKKMGIPVVCTTYDVKSKLAALSDVTIYKYSGEEESYIETKGHFASLACLMLCFMEYGRRAGIIFSDTYERCIDHLKGVSRNVPLILEDVKKWYEKHRGPLLRAEYARYVANGEYEGAALEGGLKIAETAHMACIFYETEEFMHRATTQIDRKSVIFILAPEGTGYQRNLDLKNWASEYSENVFFVTSRKNAIQDLNALKISSVDAPYFSTMEYILAFEALAYYLCEDLNQSVVVADNDGASEKLNTHIAG